ncbi:transposase [Paenibacillus macerans]|uniref:transposase n=1 Tax=Paenibacillus macerans TaxID=44252 RepID=UPI001D1308CD|nr:transposase [Paenibacillus macerans]
MNIEVNTGTKLQPFSSRYQSEQDCMEALIAMKWPSGFVCPRCAHTRCSRLASSISPCSSAENASLKHRLWSARFLKERICPLRQQLDRNG